MPLLIHGSANEAVASRTNTTKTLLADNTIISGGDSRSTFFFENEIQAHVLRFS